MNLPRLSNLFICAGWAAAGVSPAIAAAESWHFEEPFESETYQQHFEPNGQWNPEKLRIQQGGARADSTASLLVTIPAGHHTGANFSYVFEEALGFEPEALYSRYFVKFSSDWISGQGGKLPGPSGTYGRAGWGGRAVHGDDGWSARMGFHDSWWKGEVQLSYYAYHMDASTRYGDHLKWERGTHFFGGHARGSLEPGRWYCVESYIRLNDPGRRNGVLTGWVDGELALQRKDIRFRSTRALKIEKYWVNVYYGGGGTPDRKLQLTLDDLALSTERVGCG